MADKKLPIGATHQVLPLGGLEDRQFERLCLWLVKREGFEDVQHLGAAGHDFGCDISARKAGSVWAFQCKRRKRFSVADAREDIDKLTRLPPTPPAVVVFMVVSSVTKLTRDSVRELCKQHDMNGDVWAETELDEKIKRYPDLVSEFFAPIRPPPATDLPWTRYLELLRADYQSPRDPGYAFRHAEGYVAPRCGVNRATTEDAVAAIVRRVKAWDAESKPFLLLGEYGQGKTVICGALANEISNSAGPIPLLLPLRDLPLDRNIGQLAAATLTRRYGACFVGIDLLGELQSRRFIFLLDGLDELIARRGEKEFLYYIDGFLTEGLLLRNPFLVTSRPNVIYRADELATLAERVDLFELRFFSDAEVRQFFELRGLQELGLKVLTMPVLKDVRQRPLFLDMIAASANELTATETLQDFSDAKIYDTYVSGWYRRELRKLGGPLGTLKEDEVFRILSHAAFEMGTQDLDSIPAETLGRIVGDEAGGSWSRTELAGLVSQAEERLVLVPELDGDSVRFTFRHESLRSFFVARHLHRLLVGGESFVKACEHLDEIALEFFLTRIGGDAAATQALAREFSATFDEPAAALGHVEAVLVLWAIRTRHPLALRRFRRAVAAAAGAQASTRKLLGSRLEGVDLSRSDLSALELTGANLRRATLVGANFAGTTLTSATLDLADLSDADLTNCCLTGASLKEGKLARANLSEALAVQAVFTRADLAGARLVMAQLTDASFDHAHMQRAVLDRADLTRASLRGADLKNGSAIDSTFVEAKLNGCVFYGAATTGSDFTGANVETAIGLRRP
jgi:uncharacterized protein YjbI with pentapeptide repeats